MPVDAARRLQRPIRQEVDIGRLVRLPRVYFSYRRRSRRVFVRFKAQIR